MKGREVEVAPALAFRHREEVCRIRAHYSIGGKVYYPDLGNKCQVEQGPYVRAIGWLSSEHSVEKGEVPQTFIEALRKHIRTAWQPVAMLGEHVCEFCPTRMDGRFIAGSSNVWIPGDGVLYVAPELVVHYIEAHGYKPPDEFITATLECPEQHSEAYRNQMRQFPARWLQFLDM